MKKWAFITVILLVIIIDIGWYLVYLPYKNSHESFSPNNMTATQTVAYNFFQACSTGDWNKAESYCHYVDKLKPELDGMTFITLGKPYTTFWYPGVFIPYSIKLKSGEIKKFRIAIRNDNPKHQWLVDGGL